MGEFKLDFAGIGVAKSGTTWIAKCLEEHPQVCLAVGKETNFFVLNNPLSALPVNTRYFGRSHHADGMEWYRTRFEHHRPGQLRGEYSNSYLGDPESARLLHEHNPAVKLMCCFRNPVDMIYAAYYQLSRVQPLPDSFEETLARYPQFLAYGRYHHNLQPFLARFPREQILFMVHDDMKKDSAAFYRRICAFLGIDAAVSPPSMGTKVNPRTVIRSRRIRDLRTRISQFMGRSDARQRLRVILWRSGIGKVVLGAFRLNETPGEVPPMDPATRQRLVAEFQRDNDALAGLLGRDLSHWNA